MPRLRFIPVQRSLGLLAAFAVGLLAPCGLADDGPSRAHMPDDTESGTAPDLRPAEVRGMSITNKLGDTIPLGLTFTDLDGKAAKLADYFNRPSPTGGHKKPVVLMMVYYRCPILCPLVLEKFTKALNDIDFTAGSEFDALIVSFDERDLPADAARRRADQMVLYKQPTNDTVRNGWNFLTCGNQPENAKALADALGFPYRYFPNTGQYSHGSAVFILTPEGKLSRYLLGMNYPPRDVRLALIEAGDGKVGTLVDRFTFWCYHYDPSTGSYSLVAMRVMQVGAAGCAVLLGGFLSIMFAHERRKRRRTGGSFRTPPSPLSETVSTVPPALGAGA